MVFEQLLYAKTASVQKVHGWWEGLERRLRWWIVSVSALTGTSIHKVLGSIPSWISVNSLQL